MRHRCIKSNRKGSRWLSILPPSLSTWVCRSSAWVGGGTAAFPSAGGALLLLSHSPIHTVSFSLSRPIVAPSHTRKPTHLPVGLSFFQWKQAPNTETGWNDTWKNYPFNVGCVRGPLHHAPPTHHQYGLAFSFLSFLSGTNNCHTYTKGENRIDTRLGRRFRLCCCGCVCVCKHR